jgi:hypothetical protein
LLVLHAAESIAASASAQALRGHVTAQADRIGCLRGSLKQSYAVV